MHYREAIDWLFSTQMFGIKLGLEGARHLLKEYLAALHARGVKNYDFDHLMADYRHYSFAVLVVAIAAFVHRLFEPHFNDALAIVAQRDRDGVLSNEDLVEALVIPVIRVFHTDETGRDAIRFIARLAADGDDAGQALLLKQVSSFLIALETHFAARMPDKPRDKLQLQLLLGLSSTIYGLTVIGTLRHAPFDDGAPLYSGRFDDLIRDYVHFVGRGLLGA